MLYQLAVKEVAIRSGPISQVEVFNRRRHKQRKLRSGLQSTGVDRGLGQVHGLSFEVSQALHLGLVANLFHATCSPSQLSPGVEGSYGYARLARTAGRRLPSTEPRRVRRISCLAITAEKLCSRASALSAPITSITSAALQVAVPGVS